MAEYDKGAGTVSPAFGAHMYHDDRFRNMQCTYCSEKRPAKLPEDRLKELVRSTRIRDFHVLYQFMHEDGYRESEWHRAWRTLEDKEIHVTTSDLRNIELRPEEYWDKPTWELFNNGALKESEFMPDQYGHYYWTKLDALNEHLKRLLKRKQKLNEELKENYIAIEKTLESIDVEKSNSNSSSNSISA